MKGGKHMKIFGKRIVMGVIAIVLCASVAFVSNAVPAIFSSTAAPDRRIIIDTTEGANDTYTVLSEDFLGIGDNHWDDGYYPAANMNDAYFQVNYARANKVKAAYMRMLFQDWWIIDLTKSFEEQEAAWTSGDYYLGEQYQFFMRNVEMLAKAGTVIQFNMYAGADVESGMYKWYALEDGASEVVSASRVAPKYLKGFAKALVFMVNQIQKVLDEHAIEGVNDKMYLSFNNETQGLPFGSFYDKREYWCQMLTAVHEELKATNYEGTRSEFQGKNMRELVTILGTDLAQASTDTDAVEDYIDYVVKYADEYEKKTGDRVYDKLSIHVYSFHTYYDNMDPAIRKITNKFPDEDICVTEYHAAYPKSTVAARTVQNFKYSEASQTIMISQAGYTSAGTWSFMCAFLRSLGQLWDYPQSMWGYPSEGMEKIGAYFPIRSMSQRYIPKHSACLETTCTMNDKDTPANDILATTFIKENGTGAADDEITILVDSNYKEENEASRNVAIHLGSKYAGMKLNRHVVRYKPGDRTADPDKPFSAFPNGINPYYEGINTEIYYYDDGNGYIVGGENAIMAPVESVVEVGADGIIKDILPDDHTIMIYTTVKEAVQVYLDDAEQSVDVGGTVTFNASRVYGAADNNQGCTFSIIGKCTDEANKNNGGSLNKVETPYYDGLVTENCGSITPDGVYTATGVTSGDCIAIRVEPDADPTEYSVAIVNIN